MVRRVLGIGNRDEIAPILASSDFFLLEGCSNFTSVLGNDRRGFSSDFSPASLLEFIGEFPPKPPALSREI